jgi:VWFA-related protein
MLRTPLLLGIVFCPLWIPHQQEKPQVERQPSRFGVEVNYVEVDVKVTDGSGHFISDLGPEDFTLLEEGEPQEIIFFSLVNLDEKPSPEPEPTARMEPRVVSNRDELAGEVEGQVYVLVLDDFHTEAKRNVTVRTTARRFIEKQLSPADMAVVVHTSGTAQGLTRDRTLLLEAVDRFVGKKLRSASLELVDRAQELELVMDEDTMREQQELRQRELLEGRDLGSRLKDPLVQERMHRADVTLALLSELSESLGELRGRRKIIVYFGEGIEFAGAYGPLQSGGHDPSVLRQIERAAGIADWANVSIYAVDPRGLMPAGETMLSEGRLPKDMEWLLGTASLQAAMQNELHLAQDSLREITEETGGFAILDQNDLAAGLNRIVEDNSRYYLLGYYPSDQTHEDVYRKIEVRLNRPEWVVHAREGYLRFAKAETDDVSMSEVAGSTGSGLPARGIPLRATTTSFRPGTEADRAVVVLVLEMEVDGFNFSERDGQLHDFVEMHVVAEDGQGKTQTEVHRQFGLALRPPTYEVVKEAGFRAGMTLELPPGRQQLRIAAVEKGAGLRGGLSFDLEVPDYRAPQIMLSSIVLTSENDALVPVFAAPEDRHAVQLLPSTRPTFSRSDELLLSTEIYWNLSSDPDLDVSTTFQNMEEEVVYESKQGQLREFTMGGEPRLTYRSRIPLARLAPGTYILQVNVQSRRTGEQATRRVAFEIR